MGNVIKTAMNILMILYAFKGWWYGWIILEDIEMSTRSYIVWFVLIFNSICYGTQQKWEHNKNYRKWHLRNYYSGVIRNIQDFIYSELHFIHIMPYKHKTMMHWL